MSAFGNYEVIPLELDDGDLVFVTTGQWALDIDAPVGKVFLSVGTGEVSPGVVYYNHPINNGTGWRFVFSTNTHNSGTMLYLIVAEMGC